MVSACAELPVREILHWPSAWLLLPETPKTAVRNFGLDRMAVQNISRRCGLGIAVLAFAGLATEATDPTGPMGAMILTAWKDTFVRMPSARMPLPEIFGGYRSGRFRPTTLTVKRVIFASIAIVTCLSGGIDQRPVTPDESSHRGARGLGVYADLETTGRITQPWRMSSSDRPISTTWLPAIQSAFFIASGSAAHAFHPCHRSRRYAEHLFTHPALRRAIVRSWTIQGNPYATYARRDFPTHRECR